MKTKELLQAIGDIRPDYIEAVMKHGVTEAESAAGFVPETTPEPQRSTVLQRVVTTAALVACTALVIGCGFWIYRTGRAARENSELTNLRAEHTVEIEPATTGQTADETGSSAVNTDTEASTSPKDSGNAGTVSGTEPAVTDTQTQHAATTTVPGSASSAQLTQATEYSSGSTQTMASSSSEAQETTERGTSDPQKNYTIDVRVIRKYTFSEEWQTDRPRGAVIHSIEDIYSRNADGDLLSETFKTFLTDDSVQDWRTDEFFAQNDVILSGLYSGSGSYSLGLRRLTLTESGRGDPPRILLEQLLYKPETWDEMMCGYFMAVRVPKGMIEGYPRVTADVQYIQPEYDPVTGRMADDRLNFWRESCKEELCFSIED